MSHQEILDLPACSDVDPRTEADAAASLEVEDAFGKVRSEHIPAATSTDASTLADALDVSDGWLALPTKLPDWVACQYVDFGGEGASGFVDLELRDAVAASDVERAMHIQVSHPAPLGAAGPYPWLQAVPIVSPSSEIQELVSLEGGDGDLPAGEAPPPNIAWIDGEDRWFLLSGAMMLDQAVEIAESVQTYSA